MIRFSNAIIYKEFCAFKRSIKSFIFLIIIFGTILLYSTYNKCNAFVQNGTVDIKKALNGGIFYIVIFLGFVALTTTLRYWSEKSTYALDTLLSLPYTVKKIMLAKAIFPVIVGLIISSLSYIISITVFFMCYEVWLFSVKKLILFLLISLVFNFSYALINGFCMWCLSTTVSKIVQIFIWIVFLAGIRGIEALLTETGYSIKVIIIFAISMVLMIIIAVFGLMLADKESIITNGID